MTTVELLPVVRVVTPEGWSLELEWHTDGQLGIYGVNADGNRSGNPAFYLKKPNALGVVFNRGENPSAPGDPFKLDENNRITNGGV